MPCCWTVDLTTESVPVPDEVVVVVMDTGAPRTLASSAYNDRSRSCRVAVEALRGANPEIGALRDVDMEFLEAERSRLDDETFKRACHVVAENRRPLAMADALGRGDLKAAGSLMDQSHTSLRDLYEVSSAELDLFTELARAHPACHGARLTGAGFGGCAVALVDADGQADFVETVHADYRSTFNLPSSVFTCCAASGARLLDA